MEMEDETSFAGLLEEENSEFEIEIDFDLPLEKMIEAGGYKWTHNFFTKWFKVWEKGRRRVTLTLLPLREASIEEIHLCVTSKKVRVATLPELLAFGAKFQDEQRKHPILGGPILMAIDFNYIPCLRVENSYRILDLYCFEMSMVILDAHLLSVRLL